MAGQGNLTGTLSPTGQRPILIGPPPWCKMQCDPVRIVGYRMGNTSGRYILTYCKYLV